MTTHVLILNSWERIPTYHDWLWRNADRLDRDPRCGVDGWRTADIYIRRDHADKFARPCKRCFP